MKKHKIKRERPEPSGSYSREQEEHDLAYYIHDRVELMHQVFSALKPKDLKAMTPACIRHLSVDNIKELCTEELLGISSKRLCAILDGAEPPSDTESSLSASPERLETISLDSISSDEEILSEASKKSKKKHRHKDKNKKKKQAKTDDDEGDKSKASRAGLTVLELLELQARARAIRAQLMKEQANKQATAETVESSQDASSDDEVLVKEEPPEVVEISSDEEKPSIADLEKDKQNTSTETEKSDSQKVTKRVNNLVITVPQSKPSRKIKLNRSKSNPAPASDKATTSTEPAKKTVAVENNKDVPKTNNVATAASKAAEKDAKVKDKLKKKQKKKDKKKARDNGSDHDEITLQLSDSEKLDLLEDLDQKNFDRVSSQSSEDSESSSSSSESDNDDDERNDDKDVSKVNNKHTEEDNIVKEQNDMDKQSSVRENKNSEVNVESADANKDASEEKTSNIVDSSEEVVSKELEISNATCDKGDEQTPVIVQDKSVDDEAPKANTISEEQTSSQQSKSDKIEESEVCESDNIQKSTDVQITEEESQNSNKSNDTTSEKDNHLNETVETNTTSELPQVTCSDQERIYTDKDIATESSSGKDIPTESKESTSENNLQDKSDGDKQMSEGELSDRDSSDVEATEVQPEVVCISDDEGKSKKSKKKHKKKEKKNKKEKKSKKDKPDFRSGADQNFYKDSESSAINTEVCKQVNDIDNATEPIVMIDDEDDIYEILELSDDSSCYEVEGTVLSKEPTAEEIEALSAKIDEIERVEVVTEEEIREHEQCLTLNNEINENSDNVENISWKDRYLGSKKVKKVLTTSNILNALRKKNKELKKKMEESKTKEHEEKELEKVETPKEATENLEEGSMEQYNALQGSTKYVDPVKEPVDTEEKQESDEGKDKESAVTNEMKKDAKQLLKMYKKLLKYNDMHKQKDPNKKKKKKQKKKKDSDNAASVINNGI